MRDQEPARDAPDSGKRRASSRGSGKTHGLIPEDERGAGGGGPFAPKNADGDFRGGQSGAAYHGHGRLGKTKVDGQENVNAPSDDP